MENASGPRADKNLPTHTGCPSWCARHEDADLGRPDAFRTHRGPIHFGGDISVQVEAVEWLSSGRLDRPEILLNGSDITADTARALSAALLLAVAEAGQ